MKTTRITLCLLLCINLYSFLLGQTLPVRDLTFGAQGIVGMDLGWLQEYANAVAIQPWDSKIVVAVTTNEPTKTNSALLRFHPDGSLDTGFGIDGILPGFFSIISNRPTALLVQADHKILVAGNVGDQNMPNTSDFILARLLEDGSPDPTFGQEGVIFIDLDGWDNIGGALAIQAADNKIVLVGTSFSGFEAHVALVRLLPSGDFDNAFDADGKLSILIGDSSFSGAHAVALQGDKILAMGWASDGMTDPIAVVRFTETGALDQTFGIDGVAYLALHPALGDFGSALAVAPDGKIVLTGIIPFLASSDGGAMYVARLNEHGALDLTFGPYGTGHVYNNDCCFFNAPKILFQADHKILVGGSQSFGLGLSRFSSEGIPDSSFGFNGAYRDAFFPGSILKGMEDMVFQPDGRLLVAGSSGNTTTGHAGMALVRYELGTMVGNYSPGLEASHVSIFPNPVGDITTLSYFLPDYSAVSLHLVDGAGRRIQTFLQNAPRAAGKQREQLTFERQVAPGIYFLEMVTAGWTQVIRVIRQ